MAVNQLWPPLEAPKFFDLTHCPGSQKIILHMPNGDSYSMLPCDLERYMIRLGAAEDVATRISSFAWGFYALRVVPAGREAWTFKVINTELVVGSNKAPEFPPIQVWG